MLGSVSTNNINYKPIRSKLYAPLILTINGGTRGSNRGWYSTFDCVGAPKGGWSKELIFGKTEV